MHNDFYLNFEGCWDFESIYGFTLSFDLMNVLMKIKRMIIIMLLKRLIKRMDVSFRIIHEYGNVNKKDYYKLLEINRDANESEIKAGFYKMAKRYHPDLNKGN